MWYAVDWAGAGPSASHRLRTEADATNLPAENQRAMLYIHPDECIDCGACVPECPVEAVFEEADVPAEWKDYIELNAAAFA